MLENYITGNLVICLISLFILSTFKDIKVNKQLVSEEIIQKDDFFLFFFFGTEDATGTFCSETSG